MKLAQWYLLKKIVADRVRCGGLTVCLCCLLVLPGCSDGNGKKGETGQRRAKVFPVTIGSSMVKNVPVALDAIGTVEPYAAVAIKSQITGVLQSVHFSEGEDVKKGDLLFTLDKRPFTALYDQAKGALARDRAELENARKELKRYTLAAGKGYVSSEQADTAATRVATLTATIQADEAAVENSRLQLEFCSIVAPIAGRTGELLVHSGNLIKANADTAMVTVNQLVPVKVSFTVPGRNLPDIRKYQKAGTLEVIITGIGSKPLLGNFSFIDNQIDQATGTVLLKSTFANKSRELWPGQFVDIRLVLTMRPNMVVVPSPAIQVRQDGAHIYIVREDMTVEDRLVTPGMIVEKETVIEKGLAGGEKVVTNGQLQLSDGARVQDRTDQGAKSSSKAPPVRVKGPDES